MPWRSWLNCNKKQKCKHFIFSLAQIQNICCNKKGVMKGAANLDVDSSIHFFVSMLHKITIPGWRIVCNLKNRTVRSTFGTVMVQLFYWVLSCLQKKFVVVVRFCALSVILKGGWRLLEPRGGDLNDHSKNIVMLLE